MNSPLNLSELRRMGELAQSAYQPEFRTIADRATQTAARIIKSPDEIIIALRGTANVENWLEDLEIFQEVLTGRVKVHAGFLKAANALIPDIIEELLPGKTGKDQLPPIKVTGHSLGGALAKLIAYFLHDAGFNVQDVTTFASPRVGNAAWRDDYNARLGDNTLRVVACGDLVPLVPGILDGYRHSGQEVYLDGQVWLNPSRILEVMADSWRVWRAIERGDWAFVLQFHSMTSDYLRLLPAQNPEPKA